MKETIQINIGSVAFTLDRDAYDMLRNYLRDVQGRLPENDTETLDDIERHFAEIFQERIASPMQVVTLEMVQAAIGRMGAPADFGERRNSGGSSDGSRRLRRSIADRSIAGVCGGVAEFFGADVSLVRLLTLLLILFGGLSVWVYVILWIVIPEAQAPTTESTDNKPFR